jgi:cytochrome P450
MAQVVLNKPGKAHLKHPPGPKGHVIFGTAREFQEDALGYMGELIREYGDAIRAKFFLHWYGYMFFHPDHLKHILQDNNRNYTKNHPSLWIARPVLGNGLVLSDGDFWRRQRRLAQPAFHRQRIAAFGETMTSAAEAMLERWQTAGQQGQTLDINAQMMHLTLGVAGKTLFSMDLTGEADTVGRAFSHTNTYIGSMTSKPFGAQRMLLPGGANGRFRASVRTLDQVVHRIISERRQHNEDMGDLLSMLMLARDEETGEAMNDKQLRDEVMTLLLAGHETTSNALTWTWYLLSQHPEVEAKFHAELAEVLGGRVPTMEELPKLKYTRMIVDESLRLYPPVYVLARAGIEADQVGGYDLPRQAIITMSPYLTHRHPEFWPEPEKFDPERFSPEEEAKRPRYAYVPFGGGPRQCIGNTFALTEALLILATVGQRYRLTLAPNYQMELSPMVTLKPKGGLPMNLEKR